MTITVWVKREVVLNWEHFMKNPREIYEIHTYDPRTVGNIDYVQVNMSFNQYKDILTSHDEVNIYESEYSSYEK